jgi:pimeloyl-ACP methyl ester carboxylesterase
MLGPSRQPSSHARAAGASAAADSTTRVEQWRRLAVKEPYGAPARELADVAARVDCQKVEVGGSDLRIASLGCGASSFVLLHGLGGRWQHWLPAMDLLSRSRRVVALDLPGFGESESLAGPVSVDELVERVAAALDVLGTESVVVVGHSLGATLALRLALRSPERVQGVVWVGGTIQSFASILSPRATLRLAWRSPRVLAAVLTEVATAGLPAPGAVREMIIRRPKLRRLGLSPYVHDPQALPAHLARVMVEGAGAPGVLTTFRAVNGVDPLAGVQALRHRLALIAGSYDLIAPAEDLQAFHRRFPDVPIWEIDGAAHMPMLERPVAFARACEEAAGYVSPRPSHI